MAQVPFIGRLHPWQYIYLLGSFVLIALEAFIRVITLALPGPIIHLFYRASRRSFNYLSSPQGRRSRNKKKGLVTSIAQASDFVELAELFGYYAEEHIVQTGDGYLLGLHRLGYRRGEEDQRVNSGPTSIKKRVVYLHHGLMMNSEVWLCLTEKERCLPFMLVERGYDVWLGNNRGNKYSKKSTRETPTDNSFWNFSMDQFAFHDIPDSIDYILSTTGQPSLSYVGFSQGTAQAFAALSIHPTLNEKVNVFVALAPAMSPKGMSSGIVDTLVKSSPDVLFLAFGRRAILTSTTMWQSILYPPIFVRLIDSSLSFLFGWTANNITAHQKLAAYPHLYSFSSVKTVVHWFQIIRNGTFQMYDDEMQAPMRISNDAKYYKVAKFPTRNIKTPIVLVYGGSDSLVDINVMLKELPKHTVAEQIPHYEHLDFLWANNVEELVFPHVYAALDKYAGPGTSPKLGPFKPHTPSNSLQMPPTATFSDDDESPRSTRKISENVPPGRSPMQSSNTQASPYYDSGKHQPSSLGSPVRLRNSGSSFKPQRVASAPLSGSFERGAPSEEGSHHESRLSHRSNTSRPEGWWSSDEVGGTDSSPPPPPPPAVSPGRASLSSLISRDGKAEARFGEKGITLGAGKAVGGLVSGSGTGTVGLVGGESANTKKKGGKKRK
ncbi:Alpha/Beta hydrolase protein [Macrophomina phaseolina]|uniref:Alpha/Beta hydrolase protein n=1 Tax=Macrophomina phaseolina TaxID=35725 RepID=A0ABQ8GUN9_9PEZI|nr:Alpha/Beta hydrolase protein [Macrophomina phaseolina]